MTRKDYVKFAEVIRRARVRESLPEEFPPVMDFVEDELSEILAADNTRFDRDLFHEACKLP